MVLLALKLLYPEPSAADSTNDPNVTIRAGVVLTNRLNHVLC